MKQNPPPRNELSQIVTRALGLTLGVACTVAVLAGCSSSVSQPEVESAPQQAAEVEEVSSPYTLPDGCLDADGVGRRIMESGDLTQTFQLARAVPSTDHPDLYLIAIQFTVTGKDRQVGVWASPNLAYDADIDQIYSADGVAFNSVGFPGTVGTDYEISAFDPGIAAAQECINASGGENAPVEENTDPGGSLPDGWPSELPVPSGEITNQVSREQGWSALFLVTDLAEIQRVRDDLMSMMPNYTSAWEEQYAFTGDSYVVRYSWMEVAGGAYFNVQYVVEKR